MGNFKVGDRVHYDDRLTKGIGTIRMRTPCSEGFDWGVEVAEHDRVRAYHKGNVRWFLARDLRPAITITTDKFYRTRSGKPTGRVTVGDTGFEAVVDGRVRIFDKAGGAVHGDDDIVEEWVPKVGERVRRFNGRNPGSVVGHEAVVRAIEDILPYDPDGPWLLFDDDTSGYATSFEPLPVAAPQETINVGAQVDTLAEEYGSARVATTSDDDDIVEMSIGELTMAIADALRVVGKKTVKKPVKIGDAVTLSAPARIAGIDKKNAMVVLDTGGSFALPLAALRAA